MKLAAAVLFFGVVGLLTGCVDIKSKKDQSWANIILSENRFASMVMSSQETWPEKELAAQLSGFVLTKDIGQQDGPEFLYFDVKLNDKHVAAINMNADKSNQIANIVVSDTNFTDDFGVRLGMTVKEVLALRPNSKHKTDKHMHTHLYTERSHVLYEVSGDFEGPDRQDFKFEEIENWRVDRLIWVANPPRSRSLW